MAILAIDYGKKHCGLAFASGPLAEPLTTISTGNALIQIKQIITDKKIDKIIIGLVSEEFLQQLQRLEVPMEVVDETLSSHDARQALLHTSQKRRRENEHAVAAAIMLQRWLDDLSLA